MLQNYDMTSLDNSMSTMGLKNITADTLKFPVPYYRKHRGSTSLAVPRALPSYKQLTQNRFFPYHHHDSITCKKQIMHAQH